MKKSAIILNYKQRDLTKKLAFSLLEMNFFDEILVVDNSPSPEFSSSEFPQGITMIRQAKNSGYGSGMNFGVKNTSLQSQDGLFYLFNSDIIITKNCVAVLEEFLIRHDDVAIASTKRMDAKGAFSQIQYWNLPTKNGELWGATLLGQLINKISKKTFQDKTNSFKYVDVVPGSFFVVKKKVFNQVGGFDPRFFLYYEENVLSSRIKKLGYKEAILFSEKYIHNHLVSPKISLKAENAKYENFRKSKLLFFKNYLSASFLQMLLASLLFSLQKQRLLLTAFFDKLFSREHYN